MTIAQRILTGLACPYCEADSELVDTSVIYGGWLTGQYAYLCRRCWAYVGCHRDTTKSLGTLANEDTRLWRAAAHQAFDPLWQGKHFTTRTLAYRWLSQMLGLAWNHTHIGMFDEALCARTVALCQAESNPPSFLFTPF